MNHDVAKKFMFPIILKDLSEFEKKISENPKIICEKVLKNY
jgi:hypothetical protein